MQLRSDGKTSCCCARISLASVSGSCFGLSLVAFLIPMFAGRYLMKYSVGSEVFVSTKWLLARSTGLSFKGFHLCPIRRVATVLRRPVVGFQHGE